MMRIEADCDWLPPTSASELEERPGCWPVAAKLAAFVVIMTIIAGWLL